MMQVKLQTKFNFKRLFGMMMKIALLKYLQLSWLLIMF